MAAAHRLVLLVLALLAVATIAAAASGARRAAVVGKSAVVSLLELDGRGAARETRSGSCYADAKRAEMLGTSSGGRGPSTAADGTLPCYHRREQEIRGGKNGHRARAQASLAHHHPRRPRGPRPVPPPPPRRRRSARQLTADQEQQGRSCVHAVRLLSRGPTDLRHPVPDSQLRYHHRSRRRQLRLRRHQPHRHRGHRQRSHVGAVQALLLVLRAAGPALRPRRLRHLRRRPVQRLGVRRLPQGRHRHAGLVRHHRRRRQREVLLRAGLRRRVVQPRRARYGHAGARRRRQDRRLRVRVRAQQPRPVRRHGGAHGPRPHRAFTGLADRVPVRWRVLLLPAGVDLWRRVGVPLPRRRRWRVAVLPQHDARGVHPHDRRPGAAAVLLPQRDRRGCRREPGGRRGPRRRQRAHRLRHGDHAAGAVGVPRRARRVHAPVRRGGVPGDGGVLDPGHVLRPDGSRGGEGAAADAADGGRRGGDGGRRRDAVRGEEGRVAGVPGHGKPVLRGPDAHHRQLPAEEQEGGVRHGGVQDRIRRRGLQLCIER